MKNRSLKKFGWITGVVLLLAATALLVYQTVSYVNHSVHNERTAYLTTQSESVAQLINGLIEQSLEYADVCANIVSDDLQPGEDVHAFMDKVQTKLYVKNARLLLVDENCTWYGENGSSGRVTETTVYADSSAHELLYMTIGVDSTVESMVFRVRLDSPIPVNTDKGSSRISYIAVVSYMDALREHFDIAFPYTCNSFICDESGTMLYRDLDLGLLIDGSNILFKMKRVEFFYDNDEELLGNLERGESMVGEFQRGREHFFLCCSPLNYNNWFVAFVFNADQLAAGSYIRTLSIYMALLGLIFALAIVLALFAALRNRENSRELAREREVSSALERASRAKSEFLSNMSHDIRTPINGIMGMTTLARAETDPNKRDEYLHNISVSSGYLLSLVNDVLDMSKIESGSLTITEKPVNLRVFLEDCATVTRGLLQSRELYLFTDFADVEHSFVMADEVHLRQIMINILSNAVKFTPDGGNICFSCVEQALDGHRANFRFEITDTGIGMEQSFLETIWDRFTQAGNSARGTYRGTGLGMSISKRLTEAMGGEIHVSSVVNEGSSFVVEIPLSFTAEPEKEESDISGVSLLLVEDNEMNVEIAQELLVSCGASVEVAENGLVALKRFGDSAPGTFDGILMDVMMPEMDGLEATRRIRALEREDAAAVPIIAMTASAFKEDIEATKAAGMNAHLTKPMDLDAVKRVIAQLCIRKES